MAATQPEVHTYPVPEGFPDMCLPVRDEDRVTAEDIAIGFWTEEDALRMVGAHSVATSEHTRRIG